MRKLTSNKTGAMRILIGILSGMFWFSSFFAQEKHTYLETNIGLSYTDDVLEISPGFSFLYGQQTFVSETSFWDIQYGLAAPSILTMKIGKGFKNLQSGRSVTAGLRVWPSHLYVQFGFPNPRCSNEVSDRLKKRLERRGSGRTHLLCGEWNISLEAGLAGTELYWLSLDSFAIATFSHRWYFD